MTVVRVRLYTHPVAYVGGGEVQVLRVSQELARIGLTVLDHMVETSSPDVVHFFGLHPRLYAPLSRAYTRKNVPYFVTPIFYPVAAGFRRQTWQWAQQRFGVGYYSSAPEFLSGASGVFPNTTAEANYLRTWFSTVKVDRVIPNAVDTEWLKATTADDLVREVEGEYVLNVARLEPRKNQLRLAQACREIGVPLVIAGDTSVDPEYARACEAVGDTTLLGPVVAQSPRLAALYDRAAAFALPSLCETPGIAALEAASAGVPVVVTSVGGAREYLGDLAHYVNPKDVRSMVRAIEQALRAPRVHLPRALPTWNDVAQMYRDEYRIALEHSPRA